MFREDIRRRLLLISAASIDRILKPYQPFAVQAWDCDNGAEFINRYPVKHFADRKIAFTRSHPYHKNDNAHVEQRNYSHVRQLLGYRSLDNQEIASRPGDIMRDYSLLRNLLYPSRKIQSKVVSGDARLYEALTRRPQETLREGHRLDPRDPIRGQTNDTLRSVSGILLPRQDGEPGTTLYRGKAIKLDSLSQLPRPLGNNLARRTGYGKFVDVYRPHRREAPIRNGTKKDGAIGRRKASGESDVRLGHS